MNSYLLGSSIGREILLWGSIGLGIGATVAVLLAVSLVVRWLIRAETACGTDVKHPVDGTLEDYRRS